MNAECSTAHSLVRMFVRPPSMGQKISTARFICDNLRFREEKCWSFRNLDYIVGFMPSVIDMDLRGAIYAVEELYPMVKLMAPSSSQDESGRARRRGMIPRHARCCRGSSKH